jgi:ABC-type transport system involved in cytochrome c biogenesis permease subunit
VVLGLAIHVGGIVARVVISGRPPVTNLYSSFVFVAALAVVILLVVEIMVRMGIGNLMASLCGFLALMWAWTLSIESGDTYTVLVAVLDTQFWLSTHVISVSIGYGATLAAGMLGLVLLLGSLFTPIFDSRMRKTFGKIIYGVICFALLFSFFGTVLGGLWADDSWGRFWGWDPKENGALMIVLWNAVSLHARWAGIVRERGLAALAVFGNIVTLWSWEGVNQLGVGLHAYSGMTSGASAGSIWMEPMFYLKAFVLLNLFACVVMMIPTKYWFSDAREAKLKAQAA